MLSRVRIDNFCSLSSFEFAPPSLAVLTGPNGSGKSAVWIALAKIQKLILRDATVDDCFPRHMRTAWDTRDVQRFELEFTAGFGRFDYELEIRHTEEDGRLVTRVARESVSLDDVPLYLAIAGEVQLFADGAKAEPRVRFPFGSQRSYLSVLEPRLDNKRLSAFKHCVEGLWLVSPNPYAMLTISTDEDPWLRRDGANFASWYRGVIGERTELIEEMADALGRSWPGFRLRLGTIGGRARELQAEFRADDKAYKLLFNHLSEGQRTLTLLYALVLFALRDDDDGATADACLFIDEPENHVSLGELQPWLQLLSQRVEERRGQALVISHNPEIIDFLAADDAFVFSRPGGGPTKVESLKLNGSPGQTASQAVLDAAAEARRAGT